MKITIKRPPVYDCWLFSELLVNGKKLCDTLEFGDDRELKCGIYSIEIRLNKRTQNNNLCIVNENNEIESFFVPNNNYIYQGIEFRKLNNWISVGSKSGICYLKNGNGFYTQLVNLLFDSKQKGEKLELLIK